jgi:hypothetical protein
MEQAVLFLGIFCLISQIQLHFQAIGDKEDFFLDVTHLSQCQDFRKSVRFTS